MSGDFQMIKRHFIRTTEFACAERIFNRSFGVDAGSDDLSFRSTDDWAAFLDYDIKWRQITLDLEPRSAEWSFHDVPWPTLRKPRTSLNFPMVHYHLWLFLYDSRRYFAKYTSEDITAAIQSELDETWNNRYALAALLSRVKPESRSDVEITFFRCRRLLAECPKDLKVWLVEMENRMRYYYLFQQPYGSPPPYFLQQPDSLLDFYDADFLNLPRRGESSVYAAHSIDIFSSASQRNVQPIDILCPHPPCLFHVKGWRNIPALDKVAALRRYSQGWRTLYYPLDHGAQKLKFADIPWPLWFRPHSILDFTDDAFSIWSFLLYPSFSSGLKVESVEHAVRNNMKESWYLFKNDEILDELLGKVDEKDRSDVHIALIGCLNALEGHWPENLLDWWRNTSEEIEEPINGDMYTFNLPF